VSTPYLGEIRLFPYFRGAPTGWALCDGGLLPISQNDALYAVIGTTYGGDGISTFALPDLRGRVPIHQGQGPGLSQYVIGEASGTEQVTLLGNQMAAHFHNVLASTAPATAASPSGNVTAAGVTGDPFYASAAVPETAAFPASTLSLTGNNLPHENCAPTLTLNYCIATSGIFPSQP